MDTASEVDYVEFVRANWRDLVRAAVFLGAHPSEAEELAQLTCVRCYTKWDRVSRADNREAYVYRMLLNQLRDSRRTRWWRSRVDAVPDLSVADDSDRVLRAEVVRQALRDLPEPQRDVVVLRYFVQLTEVQTAEALGIATGTVKSRLSRALSRLADSTHLSGFAEESP